MTEQNNASTIMDEGEAILDSGSLFDVDNLMMEGTPSMNSNQQQMATHQQPVLINDNRSNEDSTGGSSSTTIPVQTSTRRKRASSSASTTTTTRRNSTASTPKPKKKKNDDADDEEVSEEGSVEDSTLSHLKLLPNQRSACPMDEVPSNQQGRYWIFETSTPNELNDVTVRVTMKIRGEEAKNYVPDKLYSSHKYVVMHEISGKTLVEKYPLIVSKIHVINPANREELRNSKNTNKLCLMGTMETALTKSNVSSKKSNTVIQVEEVVKGLMKVQFTDVSYHHEKGHFGFIIHYYNPANLDKPLFSLIAPPFNVFARKPTNENQTETLQPTKPKPSKKKRKSTDPDEDGSSVQDVPAAESSSAATASSATNPAQPAQEEPVKKKTRRQTKKQNRNNEDAQMDVSIPEVVMNVSQPSQNMQLFNSKLEAILAIKKQLGQDANKKASELALQNLLLLEPVAAHSFLLNPSSDNSSGTSNIQ
ncbi:predicted protein [Naegleria gruberi]|uniref:Predicted protein n=1 Tax=Naegleria gruberi TaxID=5762 RepID=D2VNE8_NAEGR|nr:uncharacterized protein NAEGRDRAFT_50981 [Naegleria gruberi]EFC41723.1 predicted protein [Naegleria gruberi]|eukprot:XP_002674467.1 predicted protein [Naegleria gruberi strain NEG-M]